MYIVFEGVVGTGKSTQSKKLADYLRSQYPDRRVELVREPGGTEIAESIRTLVQGTVFEEDMHPLTDAYLYAAARAQLLHGYIKPLLDKKTIIISDRSFISSLTIQGQAQGLGMDTIWNINQEAIKNNMPDVFIGMNMPIILGYSRTFDEDGDKFESKPLSFYEKIQEGYAIATQDPRIVDRRARVDALGSVDDVFERVLDVLRKRNLLDRD